MFDLVKVHGLTLSLSFSLSLRSDKFKGLNWSGLPPISRYEAATPEQLEALYNQQLEDPSYKTFLQKTNVTVFGTIDDHDMGMNNADETYEFKVESVMKFVEFMGISSSDAMYQRAKKGLGVYGIKVFDFDHDKGRNYLVDDKEAGIDPDIVGYEKNGRGPYKNRRFAIIVLDVRSFKTPWGNGLDAYRANYKGDFLGETQWKWLNAVLQNSNAEVNIIVNGLQVHPFRHPNSNLAENWSQFPTARQRLYDTILQSGAKAPLLISGDVHMAQLMRKDCWLRTRDESDTTVMPLIEFTTSGMTHAWGTCFASTMKFHTTWKYYPMHILSKTAMSLAHWIMPMPDLINSHNVQSFSTITTNLYENGGGEGAKQGKQYSLDLNFGEVEFDWDNDTITLRALGKDPESPPLLSATYKIQQLSGSMEMPGAAQNLTSYVERSVWLRDGNLVDGKYTCINHNGSARLPHIITGIVIETLWIMILLTSPLLFAGIIIRRTFSRNRKKMKQQ
jgi:hypothetical protein